MKSSHVLSSHFRIHWKLILSIALIWTLFVIGIFCLPLISEAFTIGQAILIKKESSGEQSLSAEEAMVTIDLLYGIIFGGVGMTFYGAFIVVLVNKILLKEISSNKISLWPVQPYSRKQVILIKFLFLLICISIFYAPSFLMVIIISTKAHDAHLLYVNILLGALQVYLFLLVFSALIFIIALALPDRATLANTIFAMILGYYLFVFALKMISLITRINGPVMNFFMDYVGLQALITNLLVYDFDKDYTAELYNSVGSTTYVIRGQAAKAINFLAYGLQTIAILVAFGGLTFGSLQLFKKTSFRI